MSCSHILTDDIVLPAQDINLGVHVIAQKIRATIPSPCFWIIMNGAWMFSTDLIRQVPKTTRVEFLHIRRGYSDGAVHEPFLQGEYPFFNPDYQHIMLDIISETGATFRYATSLVPRNLKVYTCSLIYKDDKPSFSYHRKEDDDFYSGYGMGPIREAPFIFKTERP